jgi:hypothetical protein
MIVAMIALLALSPTALAEPVVFPQDVILRAGPRKNAPILTVIPAGAEVDVLDARRFWVIAVYGGMRGYFATVNIIRKGAYLAPHEVLSLQSPACDFGYPYSGSSRYFTGLVELRHTGPLGALLGEHVYRPC